jgi:hypothetical protein
VADGASRRADEAAAASFDADANISSDTTTNNIGDPTTVGTEANNIPASVH